MSAVKGASKKVDPKDVSPAWKVLQMKLSEEKADKKRETQKTKEAAENGDENGFTKVVSKKNKNRKRKIQEALEEAKAAEAMHKKQKTGDVPVTVDDHTLGEATPIVAIDCEYVGGGLEGRDDILARVSIVNENGAIVYDKYVKPMDKVTDYRTAVSGIRPANLVNGIPFQTVQMEVSKLLKERIVVGHAVHNDFRVLNLAHKRKETRDTAKCTILRGMANYTGKSTPSLKVLAKGVLGIDVQKGEHDSITDARVALRLYLHVKKRWEADIKRFHRNK